MQPSEGGSLYSGLHLKPGEFSSKEDSKYQWDEKSGSIELCCREMTQLLFSLNQNLSLHSTRSAALAINRTVLCFTEGGGQLQGLCLAKESLSALAIMTHSDRKLTGRAHFPVDRMQSNDVEGWGCELFTRDHQEKKNGMMSFFAKTITEMKSGQTTK